MKNEMFKNYLDSLVASLILVAADYTNQVNGLPEFVIVTDEAPKQPPPSITLTV